MRKLQKPLAIFVNDPDAPPGGWFVHSPAWKMELGNMIPEKSQKLLRLLSLSGPSRKKTVLAGSDTTVSIHYKEDVSFFL
jgi:phosphatidylethanolamine-binding protein (PEBP) family uncharacterized protein